MGFVGVVLAIIAAILLKNNGWLLLISTIVGFINLWSWGIMHNFATEKAKKRDSYSDGFYDFTESEVESVPDWLSAINLLGFIVAIGLVIIGLIL